MEMPTEDLPPGRKGARAWLLPQLIQSVKFEPSLFEPQIGMEYRRSCAVWCGREFGVGCFPIEIVQVGLYFLGQRPVQMHIAAIDVDVLAGGMSGFV
jgi:hypothetical protein